LIDSNDNPEFVSIDKNFIELKVSLDALRLSKDSMPLVVFQEAALSHGFSDYSEGDYFKNLKFEGSGDN